jgi:hypothetical protein
LQRLVLRTLFRERLFGRSASLLDLRLLSALILFDLSLELVLSASEVEPDKDERERNYEQL